MSLFRREPALPPHAVAALQLGKGDRVLAWAQDAAGAYLVASLHALHHLASADAGAATPTGVGARAAATWSRPWSDVAAGAWEPTSGTLTVTWADDSTAGMWTVGRDAVKLASVLQERVKASLLLTVPIVLGETDLGRVSLRRDLSTGELHDQVTLRRRGIADDPEIVASVAELKRELWAQVGR